MTDLSGIPSPTTHTLPEDKLYRPMVGSITLKNLALKLEMVANAFNPSTWQQTDMVLEKTESSYLI